MRQCSSAYSKDNIRFSGSQKNQGVATSALCSRSGTLWFLVVSKIEGTVEKSNVFHKWGHDFGLQPDIQLNSLKRFRSGSNIGSSALKSMVAISKKKFCKKQYMYIHTTGVLSCFCNFFLFAKRIALEPWNLHP